MSTIRKALPSEYDFGGSAILQHSDLDWHKGQLAIHAEADETALGNTFDGYDGNERAYVLLPKQSASNRLTWERREIPISSESPWQDTFDLVIQDSEYDQDTIVKHGV